MLITAEMLLGILQKLTLVTSGIEKTSFFPQPLSSEEEKDYVQRMLAGDKWAAGQLVERNLRLVAHIAKKYRGNGRDMDDLVSIGTIGLMKAVNTYDPAKNIKLATYAARCIQNEVLMSIRSSRKLRREVYMDEPIGTDHEGNEISLADVLGTEQDEVVESVDLRIRTDRLVDLVRRLPPRERRIIKMRYGLDGCRRMTQKEVGSELGISRSYVSRRGYGKQKKKAPASRSLAKNGKLRMRAGASA
ncbi:MAG: RNA polymerase sporulation sigma factor SigK [Eubacteriales bacterium]|nr:RNA polymerase sporulation sigma factor SigK [Eubacteriales bacterium]